MMNAKEIVSDNADQSRQAREAKKKIFVFIGIVGLLGVGFMLLSQLIQNPKEAAIVPESIANASSGKATAAPDKMPGSRTEGAEFSWVGSTKEQSITSRRLPEIEQTERKKVTTEVAVFTSAEDSSPRAYSDELVTRLFELQDNTGLMPQQVDGTIHNTLQQLLSLGEVAVSAIGEYLQSKEDLIFDERLVRDRVIDEKSLRIALFDVLDQIGGEEVIGILGTELQNTNRPLEISALADMLERQASGVFQAPALEAARKTFASITRGELPGVDAGPLFQVFADYGDEATISQLIKNNTEWQIYKAVSLGQASEGKGIAGLTQLLQDSKDSSTTKVALRMLAQGASQYPEAQEALVEHARSNQIPDQEWPKLALVLTGKYQYQLMKPQMGNLANELEWSPFRHEMFGGKATQTLYFTDISQMSSEEYEWRLAVIDDLLTENDNPAAVNALEDARLRLANSSR